MARTRPGAESEAKLARFAELIAEGIEVQVAGERLGYSRGGAQKLMRRLREVMGGQAR